MKEQIASIQAEVEQFQIGNESELEQFRIQFVGRKGRLAALFDQLKDVPAEQRREVGQALNGLKNLAEAKFEEAQAQFGFLLDALQYGAPPHGGIAFGLDRIVTMMTGAESIRDVIAFPKTQRAQCLLTQAPSPVDEKQLRELHIRLRNTEMPA